MAIELLGSVHDLETPDGRVIHGCAPRAAKPQHPGGVKACSPGSREFRDRTPGVSILSRPIHLLRPPAASRAERANGETVDRSEKPSQKHRQDDARSAGIKPRYQWSAPHVMRPEAGTDGSVVGVLYPGYSVAELH